MANPQFERSRERLPSDDANARLFALEMLKGLGLPENIEVPEARIARAQALWTQLKEMRNLAERVRTEHPDEYARRVKICKLQEAKLRAFILPKGREDLVEKPDESIFRLKEFLARLRALRRNFERGMKRFERMNDEKREQFVLESRRSFDELNFLLRYVEENLPVEVVGESVIYSEGRTKLDITETRAYLETVASALRSCKNRDEELSLFEELERKRNTIRPGDFLKLPLLERIKLVTNIASWDNLRDNTLVVIDFGENETLEQQIGLGDLMPPEIREIEVNGVLYTRRGNQGFYNDGEYLPIFDGSRVTLKKRDTGYAAQASRESASENVPRDRTIAEVARDFLVDEFLLEAVVLAVKEDSAEGITDEQEFLHIAARYLQNAQMKYEKQHGTAMEGNHYKQDFIVFALHRFNLFNSYQELSQNVAAEVLQKYAALRKITFEPMQPKTVSDDGEVRYEPQEIARGAAEFEARIQPRLQALRSSLAARGLPAAHIDATVLYAQKMYEQMARRMGAAYHSQVTIQSASGHRWTVNNNCVGFTMSAFENLPFAVLSGRQSGARQGSRRTYASNFYWGSFGDGTRDRFIRSIVSSDHHVYSERVTPSNADAVIGQYLAPGECAVINFWNHVGFVYKDIDGRVMLVHSGADVRPRQIDVPAGQDPPPGYERMQGTKCRRIRGSKVNEVPLGYFLAHKQTTYGPGRNEIKLVPLSALVADNMNDSRRGSEFSSYLEGHRAEMAA